jgi:hypothetical protein
VIAIAFNGSFDFENFSRTTILPEDHDKTAGQIGEEYLYFVFL